MPRPCRGIGTRSTAIPGWEYLRANKLAITVFDDYDTIVDKNLRSLELLRQRSVPHRYHPRTALGHARRKDCTVSVLAPPGPATIKSQSGSPGSLSDAAAAMAAVGQSLRPLDETLAFGIIQTAKTPVTAESP